MFWSFAACDFCHSLPSGYPPACCTLHGAGVSISIQDGMGCWYSALALMAVVVSAEGSLLFSYGWKSSTLNCRY